jgi:undecaprenyl-diphosphatase
MRLVETVLLSALQGVTEVLPVSRSGHAAVARIFLMPGEGASLLEGVLHLGTAVAIGVLARRRLAEALAEGVRGIARPALFKTSEGAHDAAVLALASFASLLVGALLKPYMEVWGSAPVAVGMGLIVMGIGLASVGLAPRPHRSAPTLGGALAVGVAHGLAAFPGASRVGAALLLLLWLGVKPGRALDLSLLLTAPGLVLAFAQAALGMRGAADAGIDMGTAALGLVIAFVSAAIGAAAIRALLAKRRVGALALWMIPLGLATLAYARALPGGEPGRTLPAAGGGARTSGVVNNPSGSHERTT